MEDYIKLADLLFEVDLNYITISYTKPLM